MAGHTFGVVTTSFGKDEGECGLTACSKISGTAKNNFVEILEHFEPVFLASVATRLHYGLAGKSQDKETNTTDCATSCRGEAMFLYILHTIIFRNTQGLQSYKIKKKTKKHINLIS